MNIIVGTAGHIDHGKTALIKALTGTDTDRLPEEKKRGITIDLGFAELDIGPHKIGFVDVPGHERFIKNMLAGASGIDLVMLIVAADEGVMPQTREHFDICRLLGVQAGLVVITKKDLVDEEMMDLVRLDVQELTDGSFLADDSPVEVSSTTGDGIEELREAITAAAGRLRARRGDQVLRLPIDRSFVVKGFGTVVTGTLASGPLSEGDELELLPVRQKVRVRGLQSHGKEAASASSGQRIAVNLAGVDHEGVRRGMTLSVPAALEPTQIFDAEVEVLKNAPKPLRSRQRVRVNIGTAEALARVHIIGTSGELSPGETGPLQLWLEIPVIAVMGETFIIRSYSPQTTIAGGHVVDPLPAKHRARDSAAAGRFLEELTGSKGDHDTVVRVLIDAAAANGTTRTGLIARTGWKPEIVDAAIDANACSGSISIAGDILLPAARFAELKKNTAAAVAAHHKRDPLSKGMPSEVLREKIFTRLALDVFKSVLAELEREKVLTADKGLVRSSTHSLTLTADEEAFLDRLKNILSSAGLEPPKIEEAAALALSSVTITADQARRLTSSAAANGELVRVSSDLYFNAAAVNALIEKLRQKAAVLPNRVIDMSDFKALAGVSRKYAIPLLEHFDRAGITKRAGDKRIVV